MSFLSWDPNQAGQFQSPVKHLWPKIELSLVGLTAQTKSQLCDTGVELTLDLVDSPKFICGVMEGTSTVKISTGCLQMLWAACYLNFLYYCRVIDAGGPFKSVTIDPMVDKDLNAAMTLFGWSLNVVFGDSADVDWSRELPQPVINSETGSWQFFADRLTLLAIGYLLLHEAAHVYLKHGRSEESTWSIEQEKEADAVAVDWLLQDAPSSTNGRRIERGIAVASALIMQCAKSLFTKEWGGQSHPPTWQRLDQVVRQIESDPHHPIFAFLVHLVGLYRSMSGTIQFSGSFGYFLDGFDDFIETVSREHKRQSTSS
jgi:hypothetical protein